jgi:type II secretion system protein G
MTMACSKARRGFTLIEMLVVLAIVGLLLTLAAPRYFASLDKSRGVALEENLKVLRVTLDRFYADRGRFPDSLQDLVDHKYLRAVPVDPVSESDRTWVLVPPQDPEQGGIADVKSGAPGQAHDGRSYDSL